MTGETLSAIVIHPMDDVAVALRPIAPGSAATARIGDEIVAITVKAPIALGHKIALRAVEPGEPIRKYGEVIGVASQRISPGDHVHVHNVRSRRAQSLPRD
jgi:hypothetical protein